MQRSFAPSRVNDEGLRSDRAGARVRAALSAALAPEIEGEVRFDGGSRALYATDASNYRQVPIGVVLPRTVHDVIATVRVCREHGAPVLPRGGGTSLCGQCCNVAVIIDFSKYLNRIVEIDRARKIARVQPGVVLDDLRHAANREGLTFGPDPATHNHNTLGGMIGNNSCGPHSVMAGETVQNVISLDVLTYDGLRLSAGETGEQAFNDIVSQGGRRADIYSRLRSLGARHASRIRECFPEIPRRVSGYNLRQLLPERGFHLARALVGSEGTCATVLEATLRLVDNPPHRVLLVLGYEDVFVAADHVPEVMGHGPIALEGMDDLLVQDMAALGMHPQKIKLLPEGRGWLLVEFGGGSTGEASAHARRVEKLGRAESPPSMALFEDPERQALIWKIRESGLGATAHVPNKPLTWEGWEDSAVPPEQLGGYLRQLRQLLDRYGYHGDLYGHFGQGCVHTRIDFDLVTAAGIARYRAFIREAAELVVNLGGSISGEHGDGQSKAALLPIMFGAQLVEGFREFKRIWDPDNGMNPGKVVAAYAPDENLRLGTAYNAPAPRTFFSYPEDSGDFPHAMLRCVGVGECRKKDGTMCPSYMATGEEMHSTRGRARLLFEMLQGDAITGGWREPAVKEALELCLSCKGCKAECPVKVDMATYKAEFMAHYYARRLRPRAAYAFGLVDRWARLASHAPGVANFFAATPPFRELARLMTGMPSERSIPRFAGESFVHWFARRKEANVEGPPVLLWPDTFNNYFRADTARAAVAVLENAGWRVKVPRQHVCCGRPLYEFGMLDRAKRYLQAVLDLLAEDIAGGTPVVVLEPACASVFKDELPNLLPQDQRASGLERQVFLLPDFLAAHSLDTLPTLSRAALVHQHCHHKSVLGTDAEREVLARLGLDFEVLDSGCCGMAGSFGFEMHKYAVAMAAGERVLLPAVRAASQDTVIIADGYSCREQIEQATGRRSLHIAEVLASAVWSRRRTP